MKDEIGSTSQRLLLGPGLTSRRVEVVVVRRLSGFRSDDKINRLALSPVRPS
jgi:hypothetical protein